MHGAPGLAPQLGQPKPRTTSRGGSYVWLAMTSTVRIVSARSTALDRGFGLRDHRLAARVQLEAGLAPSLADNLWTVAALGTTEGADGALDRAKLRIGDLASVKEGCAWAEPTAAGVGDFDIAHGGFPLRAGRLGVRTDACIRSGGILSRSGGLIRTNSPVGRRF
jgi:hypothetical protein